MKCAMQSIARMRRCERGTTAIEFAIVGFVMILVCIGVIEFGRGLQMRNELAFAADLGARKVLTDSTISDTDLETALRAGLTVSDPDLLEVTIGAATVNAVQFRSITLSYPLTLLVPGLSGDALRLSLERRVPVG